MPVVSSERLTELLEKERAADAALSARQGLNQRRAGFALSIPGTSTLFGYERAIADYDEAILRFAAALPPVAAATDELPF